MKYKRNILLSLFWITILPISAQTNRAIITYEGTIKPSFVDSFVKLFLERKMYLWRISEGLPNLLIMRSRIIIP